MLGSRGIVFLFAALSPVGGVSAAPITIPDTGSYVVDRADVIDAQVERDIERWLVELEQKSAVQVKVLTVTTTGGEDFFTFVQRHAELWKLGRSGKDNGALIAVSVADKQARIHVGYGLEAVLPDSWCGSLHRQVAAPRFREGRFGQGIFDETVAVANKVADSANVRLTGIPDFRFRGSGGARTAVGTGLSTFFVLMIVLIVISRRNRGYRRWGGGLGEAIFWGSVIRNLTRGGGRSSWGGGFGSGFGGGGFGGSFGRGGRFGGGGGGGSW